MTVISSIIRIVVGAVIAILSFSTYQRTIAGVEEGGSYILFGNEIGASGGQLGLGFGVIGLLGLGLIALGVIGLLKARG